ncbi:MAG: dTMP kinase [Thermomicrobia bacterium]|nr:dTMP kinase [Thermomicrobia bacterium]
MFVTFEGPEGSGKSTQIKLLCDYLRARTVPAVQTREPGGTPIGDLIRSVLLAPEHGEMSPLAEFLLFSASRAQLVAQFIRPHLAAGRVVLCDRYADSSLAYQGYAHGLDLNALRQITTFATGGLTPDLTFYFDLDVQIGLQRKQRGDSPLDRLDSQAIEFHERVRRGYREMAAREPARWIVIDAAQGVDELQAELRQQFERLFNARSAFGAGEVP